MKRDLMTPAIVAAALDVAPGLFAAMGFVGGLYLQRSLLRAAVNQWRSAP